MSAGLTSHAGLVADWMRDAACAQPGVDADVFFSDEEEAGRLSAGRNARAIAICADCPVRTVCLTEALEREGGLASQSRFGVWGGTTPSDRARMARGERS